MKKVIFTFVLAIVSSMWMRSEALCMSPIPEALYQSFIETSGKLVMVALPCDEDPCPPCLTMALQTNTNLYYLTTDNAKIQAQLEAIEAQWYDSIFASISGTYFISEDIDHYYNYYIMVSTIELHEKSIDLTYKESEQPTDTIPLYVRDDSGSSTVDPVDPNQIYTTLTGNVLTVHNNTGVRITLAINTVSVNSFAARVRKNAEPVSFTDSISIELTKEGEYEILLTSEEWNYTIFGKFNYTRSHLGTLRETPCNEKKILRGTQILIEREGKTYMITGQESK